MTQLCDLEGEFMNVLCVGSRPSAHRNMTFSTSIKAGSQRPAPLFSLSHTDVPNKDRIVRAHHLAPALPRSCPLILSDTVDVSQSEILEDPPPPTIFSLYIACGLRFCSVYILFAPLSNLL